MFFVRVSKAAWGGCSVITCGSMTRGSYIAPLRNFRCSIKVFAKLGHSTVLVLVIAAEKTIFIEHTQTYWNNNLPFNFNFRAMTRAVPQKRGNL